MLKVSNKKMIVDSSEALPRLLALLKSPFFDVKIIFLQKRLDNVLESLKKRKKSRVMGILRWIFYYNMLKRILSTNELSNNTYFIKYEDYINDSEDQIKKLCSFVGVEYNKEMLDIETSDVHIIGGNPMRYKRDEGIKKLADVEHKISYLEKVFYFFIHRIGYFKVPTNIQF